MAENRYLVKHSSCIYHTVYQLPALPYFAPPSCGHAASANISLSGLSMPMFIQEGKGCRQSLPLQFLLFSALILSHSHRLLADK